MKKLLFLKILFPSILISLFVITQVSTTIDDFFMPGSQPDAARSYDTPQSCGNCHGGYDLDVEPEHTWQGSMMSQAMRDPLYLASLAIANQDAAFAGDLCIRCHAPAGWLSGRSEPTDGSILNNTDREGVDCHFCHELIDPKSTNVDDLVILNALDITGNKPPQSGNGMFVVDTDNKRRHGPFSDAQPVSHTARYDTFYSESTYCATCHDVSNPAFTKNPITGLYDLNSLGVKSTTFDTYEMFPVERTYSEWTMSSYNSVAGIPSTVFGGNKSNVSSCQDCHMKDVTGSGCNKNGAPIRNDLPMHDFTGGNTFVPNLIAQLYPAEVNEIALNKGVARARAMLQNAASLDLVVKVENGVYEAYVKITNETGHKLPSGYPEGRRMWIQLFAYNSIDEIVYVSGAYNTGTGELSKTDSEGNPTKIYEAKLGMSSDIETASGNNNYGDGSSFHFALNNKVVKDNRIPPRGFTNANFEAIQAAPVGYNYEDGDYFDETEYYLPLSTKRIVVKLLYQTTSKEYVEFLRDENTTNNAGQLLYNLWDTNGKSTPEIMNEAEFFTETLAVEDFNTLLINQFKVFPNPAKNEVNISFKLMDEEYASLEVYAMNGKKIATLLSGKKPISQQNIKWKVEHIPAGIYIIKFKYGNKLKSALLKIN